MKIMLTYEFTPVMNADPDLDTTDRLYGYFGIFGAAPTGVQDLTLATQIGASIANCTVEAPTFDAALQMVLPALRREGLEVVRAEVDRQGLALLQTA